MIATLIGEWDRGHARGRQSTIDIVVVLGDVVRNDCIDLSQDGVAKGLDLVKPPAEEFQIS